MGCVLGAAVGSILGACVLGVGERLSSYLLGIFTGDAFVSGVIDFDEFVAAFAGNAAFKDLVRKTAFSFSVQPSFMYWSL